MSLASALDRMVVGRVLHRGQPAYYCETGDEYITFHNCGLSEEQALDNLVAQVRKYLGVALGDIWVRRDPYAEPQNCYGAENDVVKYSLPPKVIWFASCRLVVTDKEPSDEFRLDHSESFQKHVGVVAA